MLLHFVLQICPFMMYIVSPLGVMDFYYNSVRNTHNMPQQDNFVSPAVVSKFYSLQNASQYS